MRRAFITALLIALSCVVCSAFLEREPVREQVAGYYTAKLEALVHQWEVFTAAGAAKEPLPVLQEHFRAARNAYKKQAVLGEYYYPYTARRLNSAAIKRAEDDNPDVILDPHGFQVIEEMLFSNPGELSYEDLASELQYGKEVLQRTRDENRMQQFNDASVFEALRFSVVRLMALGLAGFDSPVAQNVVAETKATLQGIEELLAIYAPRLQQVRPELLQQLRAMFRSAENYLPASAGFVSLDRLSFIREAGNPLLEAITEARNALAIPPVPGKKLLAANARNLFEPASYDLSFFSPGAPYGSSPKRIRLGKRLFFDPVLSSNGKSCASCHKPELAFTDGERVPRAPGGTGFLKRNTPTLWNSVFQTRQFYDSRTDILETQLSVVVHNKDEMDGSLLRAADSLAVHPGYAPLFREAYAEVKNPVTPFTIANAVSTYVRSLVAMNGAFDRFMRGDSLAISEEAGRGFNLFMGKAKCGTCHFIPFFNGLVPPDFDETESEVIGVPAWKNKKVVDDDEGRFLFTRAATDRHSFKTPTLRNIALTAPYMHNGVFANLRQVIRFYNQGGSRLKMQPAQRTLPPEKLHLSTRERKALLTFLHALTDTTTTLH